MIVVISGEYSSECGYCKHRDNTDATTAEEERSSFGFHGYKTEPEVYDALIQRNARRSGDFYYFPLNSTKSCCPQYAIRVEAEKHEQSKSHLKVIKKLKRFLMEGHKKDSTQASLKESMDVQTQEEDSIDSTNKDLVKKAEDVLQEAVLKCFQDGVLSRKVDCSLLFPVVLNLNQKNKKYKNDFYCSVPQKYLGLCKKFGVVETGRSVKDLAAEIVTRIPTGKHGIIRNVSATDNGLIVCDLEGFSHNTSTEKSDKTVQAATPPTSKQKHLLRLTASPSSFVQDEYELYSKYQIEIHGDAPSEVTPNGYTRFLCKSSLALENNAPVSKFNVGISDDFKFQFEPSIIPLGLGSYHVRYETLNSDNDQVVDLLAVSVLDVLPTGLSSVYFIYNTEYGFLSPGVFSALLEIQMVRHVHLQSTTIRSMKYYYLGYYIHNCTKMKYKGQFVPSEVLCPVTYNWTNLDDPVKEIMSREKFGQFYNGSNDASQAVAEVSDEELKKLKFVFDKQLITGEVLFKSGLDKMIPDYFRELKSLIKRSGLAVASKMIFYIQ
ncbi:hypothetical protein MP638_006630 [Amoeboaphelidium occidentale]|nr:hypothetical protein MP638_006630 [Amoeboaphelidium occidentale]